MLLHEGSQPQILCLLFTCLLQPLQCPGTPARTPPLQAGPLPRPRGRSGPAGTGLKGRARIGRSRDGRGGQTGKRARTGRVCGAGPRPAMALTDGAAPALRSGCGKGPAGGGGAEPGESRHRGTAKLRSPEVGNHSLSSLRCPCRLSSLSQHGLNGRVCGPAPNKAPAPLRVLQPCARRGSHPRPIHRPPWHLPGGREQPPRRCFPALKGSAGAELQTGAEPNTPPHHPPACSQPQNRSPGFTRSAGNAARAGSGSELLNPTAEPGRPEALSPAWGAGVEGGGPSWSRAVVVLGLTVPRGFVRAQ